MGCRADKKKKKVSKVLEAVFQSIALLFTEPYVMCFRRCFHIAVQTLQDVQCNTQGEILPNAEALTYVRTVLTTSKRRLFERLALMKC